MRRATSLFPGLLWSALAASTMEQKCLRCSADFSCDAQSRSGREEARRLLQRHFPPSPPGSPAEPWPSVGRPPTARGLKASRLVRKKLERLPYLQNSTITMRGPGAGQEGALEGKQHSHGPPQSPPVARPLPAQLALHTRKGKGTLGLHPPGRATEFFTIGLGASPQEVDHVQVVTNVD